jgi:glycosyltransferase involved in cell wall biosynthesis
VGSAHPTENGCKLQLSRARIQVSRATPAKLECRLAYQNHPFAIAIQVLHLNFNSHIMLKDITPLLLTYNEAPNIDRTLLRLTWANTIIIIDSYSTDETLEILATYPQVKVFQRQFDTHTQQWNYGLEQVRSPWVLSLDADYLVTDELLTTIAALPTNHSIAGYFIPFKYCVFGKPLRGTILPPRQSLFQKDKATYIDDGHTQLLHVSGHSATLSSFIHHDDRKPLSRWLWAQDRYMIIEAKKLMETPFQELSWGDRIRKTKLLAPFIILLYCLILKGGILDGWQGWYYAFQRMLAELLLSIRLIEMEQFKP